MKLSITVLILFPILVNAQFITVSGVVRDSETLAPLPSASIALKHRPIGTIANAEGRFTIHLPARFRNDTLYISVIGYKAHQTPIASIVTATDLSVNLKPAIRYLPEVVVGDSLSAKQILRRAYNNLRKNYASTPFELEGFYREIQKADGKYVSLIEAAAILQSEGFKSRQRDRIKLNQLRKSLDYRNPYVPFWDNKNLLWNFISQNFVKYKSKSLLKYTEATRKENTSIDGVPVYVILLNERPDFWLNKLYIRCDNFAIIRAEENYAWTPEDERSWKVESNPLTKAFAQSKKLGLTFKSYNGKYYPESYFMSFHVIYRDAISGQQLLDFDINQHFVVTNLEVDNITKIQPDELMKESESLKKLQAPYDTAFWRNYNVILATPLDSAIRSDLEKHMKLEDQFKKN